MRTGHMVLKLRVVVYNFGWIVMNNTLVRAGKCSPRQQLRTGFSTQGALPTRRNPGGSSFIGATELCATPQEPEVLDPAATAEDHSSESARVG